MKRTKRRYLALHIESESFPSEQEFKDAVWSALSKLFGEVGASLSGLVLINFDIERNIFVIRTSLSSLPMVRASLAAITKVAGKAASINVLAVSGTLKALYTNVKI